MNIQHTTNTTYYNIQQGINETCPCTTLHNNRLRSKTQEESKMLNERHPVFLTKIM